MHQFSLLSIKYNLNITCIFETLKGDIPPKPCISIRMKYLNFSKLKLAKLW